MQRKLRGVLCVSLLLTFSATAQNSGSASNGDFQFGLAGASGAIQYDARSQGSGARGEITFNGSIQVSNEDVDGTGDLVTPVSEVSMTVSVDCLNVSGNRAAMGGVVSSSNVPEYIGIRALLAVEDNGEGNRASGLDRFTWGVYHIPETDWVPTDADVPEDEGAFLTWWVSDAERVDDVGFPSSELENTSVDCQSFPFDSYAFEAIPLGAGQIQVRP